MAVLPKHMEIRLGTEIKICTKEASIRMSFSETLLVVVGAGNLHPLLVKSRERELGTVVHACNSSSWEADAE